MTVHTVTASPSPEGGAVVCARFGCSRPPSGTGPMPQFCVPCSPRPLRLTAEAEAAADALHEAAIYFEAGHALTFTGSQVAAILADRITALDEAYLADIARSQTRTTPCPK